MNFTASGMYSGEAIWPDNSNDTALDAAEIASCLAMTFCWKNITRRRHCEPRLMNFTASEMYSGEAIRPGIGNDATLDAAEIASCLMMTFAQ